MSKIAIAQERSIRDQITMIILVLHLDYDAVCDWVYYSEYALLCSVS